MKRQKTIIIGVITALVLVPVIVALSISYVNGNITVADVYFPVQREGNLIHHELKAYGWLVFEKGVLRVRPFCFYGTSYLIIWPHGYSIQTEGREIRVLDRDSNVVAKTGHWMTYGGGPAANMDIVKNYMGEPLDENKYPGPYWIMSEVMD